MTRKCLPSQRLVRRYVDRGVQLGRCGSNQAAIPRAPDEWDDAAANQAADPEDLSLEDHHREVIGALQEFFAGNEDPNVRELHDALAEKFHTLGGLKFLYGLLPRDRAPRAAGWPASKPQRAPGTGHSAACNSGRKQGRPGYVKAI